MSIETQLEGIDPLTTEIANYLYRLDYHEGLRLLPHLMEKTEQVILEYQAKNRETDSIAAVQGFLEFAHAAMDNKDYILLADLLKYEWVKYLELLKDDQTMENQNE